MLFFQAVLDDCRIVLIDLAAQGCNGYLHFVRNVKFQISEHQNFAIWHLRFVIATRASGSLA